MNTSEQMKPVSFRFPQATETICCFCLVKSPVPWRFKGLSLMRSRSELLNEKPDDCHNDNIDGCITGCGVTLVQQMFVCVLREENCSLGQYDRTGVLYQSYQ